MTPRINYIKASPDAYQAMLKLETYTRECGLEDSLRELVKLRASIVNGCAFCVDMHWKDAKAAGESDERLYGLTAWHEAPYYTERERAALAWTDSLTRIADTHAPDDVYEQAKQQFSEKELVNLTLLVVTINGWNRIAIGFRSEAGKYVPKKH